MKRKEKNGFHELTIMALRGCLIAKDAAFNMQELLENSSSMAYLAIKDCEKELDQIERLIDEKLPKAITQVDEGVARELLACLKFITDLERIGDLLWWVAQRLHTSKLPKRADTKYMLLMVQILQKMLEQVHEGFIRRDLALANAVIGYDREMDKNRQLLFRQYFENGKTSRDGQQDDLIGTLLMAQALERAGDHTKNLAEELFHLIEGHSLRHQPKRVHKET